MAGILSLFIQFAASWRIGFLNTDWIIDLYGVKNDLKFALLNSNKVELIFNFDHQNLIP